MILHNISLKILLYCWKSQVYRLTAFNNKCSRPCFLVSCCLPWAVISFGGRLRVCVPVSTYACEHFRLCARDSNSFRTLFSNICMHHSSIFLSLPLSMYVCVYERVRACSIMYICVCPRSVCRRAWISPWPKQLRGIGKNLDHLDYNGVH